MYLLAQLALVILKSRYLLIQPVYQTQNVLDIVKVVKNYIDNNKYIFVFKKYIIMWRMNVSTKGNKMASKRDSIIKDSRR